MKLSLVVSAFILLMSVNAKHKKKRIHYGQYDETRPSFYDSIDLSGEIRSIFAVVTALIDPTNNMICSPLSALLPLGKLALGAEGNGLKELLSAIGVDSKNELAYTFKSLIRNLEYLPEVVLNIASKLYVSHDARLDTEFNNNAKHVFKSGAEKVNFNSPHDVARKINAWVASQTDGMIKHLISSSEISRQSSLVLVNAIYFLGRWEDPFDDVHRGDFYTPTSVLKVTMMTVRSRFKYAKSNFLNAQIVEIPYAGNNASLVIVLPNNKDGLTSLLDQLKTSPGMLDTALSNMKKTYVALTMPKFKIESELDLKQVYEMIGLNYIFKQKGTGLTGIVRDETLSVSKAKQKAVIEVDEFGTEGAAASVLQALGVSMPTQVNADHPFLFFVKVQKEQLFAGVLNKP